MNVADKTNEGLVGRENVGIGEAGMRLMAKIINSVGCVLTLKGRTVLVDPIFGKEMTIPYEKVNEELEFVKKILEAAKKTVETGN